MKKSAQVVMLPTNEKADIVLKKNNELLVLPTGHIGTNPSKLTQPQHLYFLSDEEIKEGDYVIEDIGGVVYGPIDRESIVENPKKIIATTDKSLSKTIKSSYVQFGDNVEETRIEFLPQPSQSFIEHFVEEYNKGNVITEVMVEYDLMNKGYDKPEDYPYQECEILKINPKDNTITILNVKDSWSREEVIELIQKYSKECTGWPWIETDEKWIEENL